MKTEEITPDVPLDYARRYTQAEIEEKIVREYYFLGGDGIYGDAHKNGDNSVQDFPKELDLITFCVLVMHNECVVTGECIRTRPEDFNDEIARTIARGNAINKVLVPVQEIN